GSCPLSGPSRCGAARSSWARREAKGRRPFGVSATSLAQGLNGLGRVRGPMVRVEVIAYTPTEFLEEHDISIDRCRELLDTHAVTWVNVVDQDGPTIEARDKVLGIPPLAIADGQTE